MGCHHEARTLPPMTAFGTDRPFTALPYSVRLQRHFYRPDAAGNMRGHDPELSSALNRSGRRHVLSKAVVCAIRTTILRTLKMRIPAHTISMTIEEIGIRKSAENSLPTSRSAVSTPSLITETLSAAADTALRKRR